MCLSESKQKGCWIRTEDIEAIVNCFGGIACWHYVSFLDESILRYYDQQFKSYETF